jgi:hypothetical protein
MWRERVSYILISSLAFVNTGDRKAAVKSVVEAVSASTGRKDTIASNVEGKGIIYLDFISSICEHRRKKATCKECGGCGICEHGKERYFCFECGGNGYHTTCIHL